MSLLFKLLVFLFNITTSFNTILDTRTISHQQALQALDQLQKDTKLWKPQTPLLQQKGKQIYREFDEWHDKFRKELQYALQGNGYDSYYNGNRENLSKTDTKSTI